VKHITDRNISKEEKEQNKILKNYHQLPIQDNILSSCMTKTMAETFPTTILEIDQLFSCDSGL
jgi:hypothetical protein